MHADAIARRTLPADVYDAYLNERILAARRFMRSRGAEWKLYEAKSITRDQYVEMIADRKAIYKAESLLAFQKAMKNQNEFCPGGA